MSVHRSILTVLALASGLGLAGCTDIDFPDWFGSKKPLPGERRAVFPEGVPGVTQGVPPEYRRGAQQSPDAMAEPAPAPAPPPRPAPRPRVAKPRPIEPPPGQAQQSAQPRQQPAAAPQAQPAAPWPSPSSSQSAQPAQPAWPTPGTTTAR
jgi:hypothetical protein